MASVIPNPAAAAGEELPRNLQQCLDYAARHNFEVLTAAAQLEREAGARLEADAFLGPKVTLNAGAERSDLVGHGGGGSEALPPERLWNSGVELQQPLFTGGEGTALRSQSKLLQQGAAWAVRGAVNDVTFRVKQKFYDVLLSAAQIEVNRQSVRLLEEELQLEKNRAEAGTASNFQVLRAEVEVANAHTPLVTAENALRLARQDLARELGLPADAAGGLQIEGELRFEDRPQELSAALETARAKRPELKQLEFLRRAQEQGVAVERARYWPQLEAVAGYSLDHTGLENRLSERIEGWKIGARGSWRLFDSFATRGRVRQAAAELERTRLALERQKLEIDLDVQRALSNIDQARGLLAASGTVIMQAEETYRLAKARLETGAARQIDILDTQVALTQARTNRIAALHAFNVAQAELERATGAGYEGLAVDDLLRNSKRLRP